MSSRLFECEFRDADSVTRYAIRLDLITGMDETERKGGNGYRNIYAGNAGSVGLYVDSATYARVLTAWRNYLELTP